MPYGLCFDIKIIYNECISFKRCIVAKRDLNFYELKEIYDNKKDGCATGRLGKIYLPKKTYERHIIPKIRKEKYEIPEPQVITVTNEDRLVNVRCNSYTCKLCRPRLKTQLHIDIQREVIRNKLNKHQIITFPGKPLRDKIPYDKSFKLMSKDFNKLIHRIYYEIEKIKQGKETRSNNDLLTNNNELPDYEFAYITLPRAQTNPTDNNPIGFCHLHNIINYPINKKWIAEKTKKNNYFIGFTEINENQDVADYLCKDFFKDDEWIIPFGIKHYHTSRNVLVNIGQGYKKDNNNIFYKNTDIKFIENDLIKNHSVTLPFEEYLKQYNEITYRTLSKDNKTFIGNNK